MATTILNLANCATQGNTGGTFCNIEPSYILYAFAVPKGTVIPAANMITQAAFTTYVNARLKTDSKATRWQMTPKLVDFKDNTKEPTMENLDGYENTTQWLPYDWEFRFANGFTGATKNVHQIWRQFINQQQALYDFFFVDSNNVWIGTVDPNANGGLASIAVSNITINDYAPATIKTGNIYKLHLIIQDNATLNAYFNSLISTTLTSTFKALTDVSTMVSPVPTTITTTHIYVSGKIGGNTLGKQFGTTLSAITAWTILDTTNTGKIWTSSAVSYDAANDQYDITGSWSATNGGDTITVAIAAPSVITATPFFLNIACEGTNIYSFVAP